MIIGIVGLPNSGKTTIFNALTGGEAATASFSSAKVAVQRSSIDVPDERIDRLVQMFKPQKTTRARVEYQDIGGLAKGIGDGGLRGELLNAIAQSDALLHVVRDFERLDVPHPDGSINPARDAASLDAELLLSDLVIVEGRIERLQESVARGRNGPELDAQRTEMALLERVRSHLEAERPLRDMDLAPAESKLLRGFQFLTAKPMLIVLNRLEDDVRDLDVAYESDHQQSVVLTLAGRLEMELAQLSAEDRPSLMEEFGVAEPGLARVIRESYRLLGLLSFFTVGEDEVRAWTIPIGATAIDAAGAIHSDLRRGFIRADIVTYDDLIASGSMAAAKQRGVSRVEGRDHVVVDGEIVHVRFNV